MSVFFAFTLTPHSNRWKCPVAKALSPVRGTFNPSLTPHSPLTLRLTEISGRKSRPTYDCKKYVVSGLGVRRLRTLSPCPTYGHFALIIPSPNINHNIIYLRPLGIFSLARQEHEQQGQHFGLRPISFLTLSRLSEG